MWLDHRLIWLLLLPALFKAQEVHTTGNRFISDTISGAYRPKSDAYVFIPSKFGSGEVAGTSVLDSVKRFLITEIALVYTGYRKAESFQQDMLNAARWQNLSRQKPELFQTGSTLIHNVCQAGIDSDSAARTLQHGFYVYYRNVTDDSLRKAEIQAIYSMVSAMGIDTSQADDIADERPMDKESVHRTGSARAQRPMRTKDPDACRQPFYGKTEADLDAFFREHLIFTNRQIKNRKDLNAELRLTIDHSGLIRSAHIMSSSNLLIDQVKKALVLMELWNPAVKNGVTIKSDVRFTLVCDETGHASLKGAVIVPRLLKDCGHASNEELFDPGDEKIKVPSIFRVSDHAILREVFKRESALDSVLLVVDVTSSMGPYIAQVLELVEELIGSQSPRLSRIALFNDGNGKADRNKQVGSTGGISLLDEITMEGFCKALFRSMNRGNGGDIMENDLEAVLKGISNCPGCRDVILVADNFATPRDANLVDQLPGPIHWVLCGAVEQVNVHYLDLVRKNKGILHTGKGDINTLHLLSDGELITIGQEQFLLNGQRFLKIGPAPAR